uniref:Uncharacterized protein n=3 Tax=Brassiceae TaxID=981071 RepID=R4I1V2_RAPSA|nr:orf101c [Sinapis arvensis]AEX57703.1 hypothetical protein RasatMp072 [Raphanus sativus]AGY62784.1 orf101f [Eruca vesicaria subsp. sativa]AJR33099.1 orf101c [Sinapis arvensis]QGW48431.1 hypothetical protein [Raphanus sativus]QGW48696.1 hypothetical protein [Raphanus sativus]
MWSRSTQEAPLSSFFLDQATPTLHFTKPNVGASPLGYFLIRHGLLIELSINHCRASSMTLSTALSASYTFPFKYHFVPILPQNPQNQRELLISKGICLHRP